ncbi:alpha-1,4-glucan--maltose-1-phosphate maltosyltransferase [Kineococcus glutinatus]|uniref:Alpha-1,4-glucan:maltose-1-phosphate maltosyltransferase n=1 Tax=Kineococcus glutinatus TaxID=1070872 RepID=A0ABP9HTK0_9ACTN
MSPAQDRSTGARRTRRADSSTTPAPAAAEGHGDAAEPLEALSASGVADEPAVAALAAGTQLGRIPVLDVGPVVDGGRWPARAVVGEPVPITATVFREGHDAVAATAVLVRPDGAVGAWARMALTVPGTDRHEAVLAPDAPGDWGLRVEAWSDPYGTWEHDATIKIGAGVDTALMLEEGARVLERALELPGRSDTDRKVLSEAVTGLRDTSRPDEARLAAGTSRAVHDVLADLPLRDAVTASQTYRLRVERERALFSSWYEFFPRSEGAHFDEERGRWVSGTFATAARRLPAIAAMGFDVAYLTPVHPIGRVNRKGPNNSLESGPLDPGSPYAIGAAEGGHDALHPDLGTFADFEAFVGEARAHGLEVALDIALQAAPDHPWVTEHPEWFTTRADGSIAYAENPPKKYQDIYPLNFDNDPDGIYAEILRIIELWVSHGVTLFRVDNPHTKPVQFWEWLIREVNSRHPEVVFLSEAFTKPAMMHTLAKVGFQQSYTYFTWRNAAWELREYLTQLTTESAHYMRPNFWPTTHDILTPTMQYGGPAAFKLRAVLAATMVPSWGIYTGYELVEHAARPGAEEQLDNEKYQYRPRDFERAEAEGRSLAPLLRRLNEVRREHRALQLLRGTTFHAADDENFIAYSRRFVPAANQEGQEDHVIVVVNLDPHAVRETTVHVDMPAVGMDWHDAYEVEDLLTGAVWTWGAHNYVRLDPFTQPAHVLHVRRR